MTALAAKPAAVDPITLEVIRHGVVSIANQIDANMTRTAFSPYIYEYRDYAVGFVGPRGELIAQSTGGMPIFVADSVGAAVRDGLALYGAGGIHDGDVLVCNHAAVQGQHLNNTVMYTPVSRRRRAHRLLRDQRALDGHRRRRDRLDLQRLDRHLHGRPAAALDPVVVEGRTRRRRLPDHREQHAFPDRAHGRHRGAARGLPAGPRSRRARWREKYGAATFLAAVAKILDQCEAATRAKVRAIPDGTYEAESCLDDDGMGDEARADQGARHRRRRRD